jgi:hypothetical protein
MIEIHDLGLVCEGRLPCPSWPAHVVGRSARHARQLSIFLMPGVVSRTGARGGASQALRPAHSSSRRMLQYTETRLVAPSNPMPPEPTDDDILNWLDSGSSGDPASSRHDAAKPAHRVPPQQSFDPGRQPLRQKETRGFLKVSLFGYSRSDMLLVLSVFAGICVSLMLLNLCIVFGVWVINLSAAVLIASAIIAVGVYAGVEQWKAYRRRMAESPAWDWTCGHGYFMTPYGASGEESTARQIYELLLRWGEEGRLPDPTVVTARQFAKGEACTVLFSTPSMLAARSLWAEGLAAAVNAIFHVELELAGPSNIAKWKDHMPIVLGKPRRFDHVWTPVSHRPGEVTMYTCARCGNALESMARPSLAGNVVVVGKAPSPLYAGVVCSVCRKNECVACKRAPTNAPCSWCGQRVLPATEDVLN